MKGEARLKVTAIAFKSTGGTVGAHAMQRSQVC